MSSEPKPSTRAGCAFMLLVPTFVYGPLILPGLLRPGYATVGWGLAWKGVLASGSLSLGVPLATIVWLVHSIRQEPPSDTPDFKPLIGKLADVAPMLLMLWAVATLFFWGPSYGAVQLYNNSQLSPPVAARCVFTSCGRKRCELRCDLPGGVELHDSSIIKQKEFMPPGQPFSAPAQQGKLGAWLLLYTQSQQEPAAGKP